MKITISILSTLILIGCSAVPKKKSSEFESSFSSSEEVTEKAVELTVGADKQEEPVKEKLSEIESIYPKDHKSELNLSLSQVVFPEKELLSFSSNGMPLSEFINHILANVFGVNFFLDPAIGDLSGTPVTLNIEDKISKNEFYQIFSDTLLSHNISITNKNNLFYLYKDDNQGYYEKIRIGIGTKASDLPRDGENINQILPLEYTNVDSVKALVNKLTLASVYELGKSGHIMLKGNRNDILRALKIIEYIDVPASVGKYVQFLSLNYIQPREFMDKLEELLLVEGINFGVNIRATALPRQGGVVIHSESLNLIARAEYWKKKLDITDAKGKQKYMLYFPENSLASELGKGISKLLALQGGSSRSSIAAPTSSSSVDTNSGGSSTRTNRENTKPGGASYSSDDLAMVSDDNRNALIFYTTPSRYQNLLPIIKQLDVLPKQVLVEAKFLEVTLTDRFSNGVEWALSNYLNKNSTDPSGKFSNGSFTFNVTDLDYTFALKFLKQDSKVKVLSSPRVLVTDGKTANINVGSQIPVLTTQSNDVDTDRVLQSIQYRNTGVQLGVTPVVNSRGIVSLSITQSVSESSEDAASSLNSPVILNRSLSTEVIAKSGKSIVLGGLIRENNSSSDNGIPLLRDLPVLGNLFKTEGESKTRTELVLMITPRIIHNTSGLEEINSIFKDDITLFE